MALNLTWNQYQTRYLRRFPHSLTSKDLTIVSPKLSIPPDVRIIASSNYRKGINKFLTDFQVGLNKHTLQPNSPNISKYLSVLNDQKKPIFNTPKRQSFTNKLPLPMYQHCKTWKNFDTIWIYLIHDKNMKKRNH